MLVLWPWGGRLIELWLQQKSRRRNSTWLDVFRLKEKFHRRPLRLDRVFNFSPFYFVSFCTHDRIPRLARDEIHSAFVLFARRAERDFNVAVGRYVIMPEHIHLFVRGGPNFKLGRWIGLLKQTLTRAADLLRAKTRLWQEGFFDDVLRSDESYSKMELCSQQSRARWTCEVGRRVALPG